MKHAACVFLIAFGLGLGSVAVANANPGPGNSNQCAPGQQGNQDPGFKPGVCR